mgnify:CR=1 FL=1
MRLRAFIFLVFLFIGMKASAAPIISIGTGMLFERGSDGRTVEARTPFSIAGGYRFQEVDVFLEYSMFRAGDGEGDIAVDRERHEVVLWGRHFFFPRLNVNPFIGLGAGFQYERVELAFGQEVSREAGEPTAVYGAITGIRFPFTRHFEFLLEGRVAVAARYSSEAAWSLGAAAGINF